MPTALAMGAALFVLAWLLLPTWDFLITPIASGVRSDVTDAIDATTDPHEQAQLRLELARLEQEDATRRSELRSTIAQVGTALLAGIAAAWGAVAAWGQLQDNRKQAETARQEAELQLHMSFEELKLVRQGQISDRFTRAVEQLGDYNLDVRLGGIYALGRIAHDSKRDQRTVTEVLAAFVRGHSPLRTQDPDLDDHPPHQLAAEPLSQRAPDVQAVLRVLGGLPRDRDSAVIDISASNLSRADFGGADFSRARLMDTNLIKADLSGVRLVGACFDDAHLGVADLTLARLAGAYFGGAKLINALLVRADLTGAYLNNADLTDAYLNDANLNDAVLSAGLYGTHLDGAQLQGADLAGAVIEGAHLAGARANASTKWPNGFDPDAAGVIFVEQDDRP